MCDPSDQALSLSSTEVMAWVSKGIAYEKLGDPDGERSAYLGAIAANPWNALAHFNLGNVYYKAKQYDQAIVQYRRAVEIEPNLALGHFYLGRTYAKISDPESAAAALRVGFNFRRGLLRKPGRQDLDWDPQEAQVKNNQHDAIYVEHLTHNKLHSLHHL